MSIEMDEPITLEDIERIERNSELDGVILALCAAARRGVEADAEIAQLRRVIERGRDSTRTELLLSEQLSEQRAGNIKLLERAEKAEAGMAWLAECVIRQRSGTPDPKGWIAQAFEYADDRNEEIANLRAELAALKVERDEAVRTEQEEIAQIVDRWAVIHDGAEFDFDALVDEIRARNQGDSNEH